MPSTKPNKLTIRSYQVGFGDCFLLTFEYPAGASETRHLLIDCGSTGMPKNFTGGLQAVTKAIAKDCGNKLTAVVATHRHADHINGFATSKNGKGPGDTLRALKPELVVQPWTENPDVEKDATAPPTSSGNKHAFRPQNFVASLNSMHAFAELVLHDVERLKRSLPKRTAAQLSFLGEDNLKNDDAVRNLMTMGQKKPEYLSYGDKTGLEKLLPGVKIHVLGPPTPKQFPDVQKQRSKDSAEFWHILGATANRLITRRGDAPFAARFAARTRPPGATWFIPRVIAAHAEQRLELVRILDDVMNNTSLILMFEIGKMKFLFPGDAQIENWSYALKAAPDAKANCALLAQTDFYKVGHHGSLNATPKTLWGLFKKKGPASTKSGRLSTAISTMSGKHGSANRQTEVPRRPLVDALKENSTFFSTQSLRAKNNLSEPIEFTDF